MKKQAERPTSKHAWLLQDEGVARWINNIERGSIITAEVSQRRLGKACELLDTTPRAIVKYATDKQLSVKITMFDSNKNQQGILYKDEFDKCASQNKNLKIVYTITEEEQEASADWTGEHGRIDKSMLKRYLTKEQIGNGVFYICSPPGMLKAMQELLREELQIPKDRLKVEAFTGYQ